MAHEVETINGVAQMAYVGEKPWHGLGTEVEPTITPLEMMKAAGLNWGVEKTPLYYNFGVSRNEQGEYSPAQQEVPGKQALVRDLDGKVMDIVGNNWNPVQNKEAFDFFVDFVDTGNMTMNTAGSLKEGRIVWALAKVSDSFSLKTDQGEDVVESYLLFSNPHEYGKTVTVQFTPIRVVCNNTLTLSLNTKSSNGVKINHARRFDAEKVSEMLGLAHIKLEAYKESAEHLLGKRYTMDDMLNYFKQVFPATGEKKDISRTAARALDVVNTQPGAKMGEGSYWQLFNTTTYLIDHELGKSIDTRLQSAWYGEGVRTKQKALQLALDA